MTPESLHGMRAFLALMLCILLGMLFVASAQAQPSSSTAVGDNLGVALITFGPGEEVWERFGHNAIEIRDRSSGDARLYNYGIFDFDQENFFLNFARGLMTYRMAAGNPDDELPNYLTEGRWIVEQDLNLTPAQRIKLRDFLERNALPANAPYRYDYFRANCSTRVRDALDLALDGAIKAQTVAPSRGFTYRMDALRLTRLDPAVMIGIDAGLGPYADQRLSFWDESFVPTQFMRFLREIRVNDENGNPQPLVTREMRLADARVAEPAELPPAWLWPALGTGITGALGILGLVRLRRYTVARIMFASIAMVIALILGFGGLVLACLWALTDHVSAWRNENLLLFDPLCLLLLPGWFGAFRARWRPSTFAHSVALLIALLAGFAFFAKVLPAFPQDNRCWIALLLPLHLAFALILTQARAHLR